VPDEAGREDLGPEKEPVDFGPPCPRCGFLVAADFFSADQRAFLGAPEEVCLGIAYSTLLTRCRLRLEP
jgi:hypothetical protein